jgi:transposase-like protein
MKLRALTVGRAVRLVLDLHCPRCGSELKASDVSADRCGAVVLLCSKCERNILSLANGRYSRSLSFKLHTERR